MSKSVQVLGMSEYFSCLLFDILKEKNLADHLDIFLNIDIETRPVTPNLNFSYSVYEKDVAPNPDLPMVLGVSGPKNKYPVFNFYSENYKIKPSAFINVIHDSAYIANSAIVAGAAIIEQNVIISSQTQIGFGVFIKRGASIGHHCIVGDFVDINPGVVISGRVTIGKGVVIGSGAILVDGIEIGENSMVGAGSVVTKNLPPGFIAYGNPCRIIRENKEWKI